MIGRRFGRLTITSEHPDRLRGAIAYLCKCDCGGDVVRSGRDLRSMKKQGVVAGCGCTRREALASNGKANKTHGCSGTKLYDVWRQMMRRCHDQACKDFPAWGGRGIAVCAEWHDVRSFVAWANASGYGEGMTIERCNNDSGYSPGNCCWIPNRQQASNTRRLIRLTIGGVCRRADEWAKISGIKYTTMIGRLRAGWDAKPAVFTPGVHGRNQYGVPRGYRPA